MWIHPGCSDASSIRFDEAISYTQTPDTARNSRSFVLSVSVVDVIIYSIAPATYRVPTVTTCEEC